MFEVAVPGQGGGTAPAYTRSGTFQFAPLPNGDRQLVTNTGMPVVNQEGGNIIVPAGHNLVVHTDGRLVAVNEIDDTTIDLGRIRLIQVLMPELLRSIGDNLYVLEDGANAANAVEVLNELPEDTVIMQGYTEASNVTLTDELTELISVQRAYQLNARALASAEQMLGMAIKLRA
jgi:flagellar basal-body rod protein FlgG